MNELKNFSEQIKNGNIEVINQDVLVIKDYPFGFRGKCEMTFKKVKNRNGEVIERTSSFNGKISKPKKTTAFKLNIFVYDKELKQHFIISINRCSFTIFNTSFYNATNKYDNTYYMYIGKEYQHELNIKSRNEYSILLDFFKDYMNISEEDYNKIKELNGEVKK